MQQSIASHVADLEDACRKTEQKNDELMVATNLAEESDRKKTAFIQDMFHQIRTPLNIISGFAQVLRDGHSFMDEQEINTVTHDIKLNSHTISNIIDNWKKTLELEQTDDVMLTDTVDCNELCMEAANSLVMRQPDSVELYVESADDVNVITTNRACLTKILSELLHNANKYTLEGRITIGSKRTADNSICFYVADSGPGIPEADRERVFNQFTKLNDFNEGLGMGLYLCRQLALRLRGTLEIDPQYTSGTRMVLTLPAQKPTTT